MTKSSFLLQDQTTGKPQWIAFDHPVEIIQTHQIDDILDCLKQVENRVAAGRYAVGFIGYEASRAMDRALKTHHPLDTKMPLLWFAICDECRAVEWPFGKSGDEPPGFTLGPWQPSVSWEEYREVMDTIKAHISAGDTYQVNYTMRLRSQFKGDPWQLFVALHDAQRPAYSAYLEFDNYSICSVSPELFFSLKDRRITCKPMKGTVKRGLTDAEDAELETWLSTSEKNRAENLMIVDMIRNDIGKIARTGTVKVDRLFSIEKYPTVQQMTSTVSAEVSAPISQVLRDLFPCASITGVPKVKTMEIIQKLETDPRGIYTGSIGYIAPDGRAQFNVAIRTVVVDKQKNVAEYGVGSGIVWDSQADEEYAECQTKAAVLTEAFSKNG